MKNDMDAYMAMAIAKIAKIGWVVQGVGGSATHKPFGYSVGLTARQRPEIILMGGFPINLIHTVINAAANAIDADKFADRYKSSGVIDNFPVVFREVKREDARDMAKVAYRLYGSKIRLLQLFLPDPHGNFPWQTDCTEEFRRQGILNYVSENPD